MGWGLGWNNEWQRDIGYGVPAWCDHPQCWEEIDRGLAYVCCDQEPYGGDRGCGLYFCASHRRPGGRCPRCAASRRSPYAHPKPEHPRWLRWKLRDESWHQWRNENPDEVEKIRARLREYRTSTNPAIRKAEVESRGILMQEIGA